MGNTHIYKEHEEALRKQITREPYPFPTMQIREKRQNIKELVESIKQKILINLKDDTNEIKISVNIKRRINAVLSPVMNTNKSEAMNKNRNKKIYNLLFLLSEK